MLERKELERRAGHIIADGLFWQLTGERLSSAKAREFRASIAEALARTQRETAQRCAEIAKEHDALGSGVKAIRREFKLEVEKCWK